MCRVSITSPWIPSTTVDPHLSAIKSPHILELSGIGDRKILEPLGINVQLDLPSVGTNMQEHISLGYTRWSETFLKIILSGAGSSRYTEFREDQNIVTSEVCSIARNSQKRYREPCTAVILSASARTNLQLSLGVSPIRSRWPSTAYPSSPSKSPASARLL